MRPKFLHFLGMLTLLGAPCAYSENFSGRVAAVKSNSLKDAQLKSVSQLLSLKVGGSFDQAALDAAIRGVQAKGRFRDIKVFVEPAKQGLIVYLEGRPISRVREVRFEGMDSDVAEETGIKRDLIAGQNTDSRTLSRIRQKLQKAYEDRGYYFSTVKTDIVEADSDEESDVVITVSPGEPTIVTKVHFSGVPPTLAEGLERRIPLQPGKPLQRQLVDQSVTALQEFFRSNQYPTAKVEETSFQFSEDKLQVTATFVMTLGQRYQFDFRGAFVFDEISLRELMTPEILAQSESAKRISNLIEEKYRAAGFHFAKVEPKVLPLRDAIVRIQFDVIEGRRVLVDSVEFDGLWNPDLGNAKKIFLEGAPGVLARGVYWEQGLSAAADQFLKYLQARGYLSAALTGPREVFSEDKKGVRLFYSLQLGTRYLLSKISFEGTKEGKPEELKEAITLRIGEPVNREQLLAASDAIRRYYERNGFLDVQVEKKEAPGLGSAEGESPFEVAYVVKEGRPYTVGSITLEGNHRTQSKVLQRELLLKSGERFNPENLTGSEENLAVLGLFNRIEIKTAPSSADPYLKDITVLVNEVKPGFGEVGLGGFYEDPRLRLRTFLGLGYRNLFGLNQTATVRSEVSIPISQKRDLIPFVEYAAVLGYRAPYLLDIPLTFSTQVGLDSFEVATDGTESKLQTRAKIEERIEKRLSRRLTGIYRIHRLERTRTETLNSATPLDTVDVIGSTGPAVVLDFRDDIFNPTRGSYHSIDLEFAHPYLLSNDGLSFLMGIQRNSFYIPLAGEFSLGVYVGFGWAHAILDKPLPEARLTNDLALGGQGSIRGYSPRIFKASGVREMAFYNARSELLFPLFGSFSGAVFFDTGQLFPSWEAQPRYDGVGLGLRYKTPVGPVVIDLAHGLTGGVEQSKIKFYFTVGSI